MGRFSLIKEADIILDFLNNYPPFPIELIIVGDTEINFNICSISRKVNFLGHLNRYELDQFYRSSHLLIFPSRNEGSGLVCYESMSYGLPIITTNNCGSLYQNMFMVSL